MLRALSVSLVIILLAGNQSYADADPKLEFLDQLKTLTDRTSKITNTVKSKISERHLTARHLYNSQTGRQKIRESLLGHVNRLHSSISSIGYKSV